MKENIKSFNNWLNEEARRISSEEVTQMRKSFVGKKIELVSTTDPYTEIKPGDQGIVKHIDDIGTILVKWDNGSTLGLIPGEDEYKILEKDIVLGKYV